MASQRTIITGPKNGSTTYRFDNKPNKVWVKTTSRGYTLLLKGNNDSGTGSLGNDSIDGGTGLDNLTGGQGNDNLVAGSSTPGKQDQNQLLGDEELIKVGLAGGDDALIGGTGCIDRLIGDSINLYGRGGVDVIQANGTTTELVGDAIELQASATGGNDVLTGTKYAGTRTTMYGDGISFYGPARGGNDELISGQSDDYMYGDHQYTFPAPFANDPYIFDIYDQYGFFTPPTAGVQPFTYDPIIFDLFNQNVSGSGAAAPSANSKTITFDDRTSYVIPTRGTNGLSPVGGADRFVYKTTNEGNDVIFDFNPSEGDRIVLENGLTARDLQVQNNGRDTRISFGTTTILLPYFVGLSISDIVSNTDGIQPADNGNWRNTPL